MAHLRSEGQENGLDVLGENELQILAVLWQGNANQIEMHHYLIQSFFLVQTDFNKTLFLETCTMNEDPFKLYDPRQIDEHVNCVKQCFSFL